MSRLHSHSIDTAPIALGRQMVRFAPELLRYVSEHGEFPESTDQRGDFLFVQFQLKNGAKTASFDQVKAGKNFENAVKLHFDGKFAGDGYQMKRIFDEIRKMDKRFRYLPEEDILFALLDKEFPVYLYRYDAGKRSYLQVAWSADEYSKHCGKPVKKPVAKKQEPEEALPIDLGELDF